MLLPPLIAFVLGRRLVQLEATVGRVRLYLVADGLLHSLARFVGNAAGSGLESGEDRNVETKTLECSVLLGGL